VGYQEPKPLVFASFYPANQKDYENFKEAVLKLKLNDSSLSYEVENSEILGKGFRLGFLGLLHLEITQERLAREYALSVITSEPLIPYRIYEKNCLEPNILINPSDFPSPDKIEKTEEPWMKVKLTAPPQYLSALIKMMNNYRGFIVDINNFREDRILMTAEMPFKELFRGLENNLKSVTNGFGILEYSLLDYRPVALEKLEVYLAGEHFGIFDILIEREKLAKEARQLALLLKNILPAQNYPLIIQIKHGGKILARETISALKKDVTAHLYGGDRTRKVKLWQKQKKGKRRLAQYAKLSLGSDIYLKLIKLKQSGHYEAS
jgi:GTP-binding protein LepA